MALEDPAALARLLSPSALAPRGLVSRLIDASRRRGQEVSASLARRLCAQALPALARVLVGGAATLDDAALERVASDARRILERALWAACATPARARAAVEECLFEQVKKRGAALDEDARRSLVNAFLGLGADDEPAPLELECVGPAALGAVHEALLERELELARGPGSPATRLRVTRTAGDRKRAGAYYTPGFVVAHLLDRALDPVLARHVARLEGLSGDAARAAALLELRVVDMSVGAGNFLLAAARRIERRLHGYLRGHPGVRAAACGEPAALRGAIVSRCLHGVDVDAEVVALCRGIFDLYAGTGPNIVVGDALIGVGTRAELDELLAGHGLRGPLDASRAVQARVMDLLIAARVEPSRADAALLQEVLEGRSEGVASARARVEEVLGPLRPLHLPLAFPGALGEGGGGFDVVLGNPPWEEVTVETDRFWSRRSPGLQALPQRERERELAALRQAHPDREARLERQRRASARRRRALLAGPYPGLGTGDPDLYKAFTWRLMQVARPEGRLGLVLPRNAFVAKGSASWRAGLLASGGFEELCFLTNRGGWVFRDVHAQYTIALVTIRRPPAGDEAGEEAVSEAGSERGALALRGPFDSREAFDAGRGRAGTRIEVRALLAGSDTAAFPLLPGDGSAEIWARMRRAPRLDLDAPGQWRARPASELHATHDKTEMLFETGVGDARGTWPVYKGQSFDLWRCDTGRYYARARPERITALLQARRRRAPRRSALAEFSARWREDPATLPCLAPRIAFRDVTRATDSRTMRAALVPGEVVLANQAPYLLWPRGDARDVAYVLGVLCSIPFDWFVRRVVETHMNFHVLNPAPIPRPTREDPRWRRVVALAGRLAASDERFAAWAREVGVACGPLPEEQRAASVAELDAVVARLYGLDAAQTERVFRSFHVGWDPGPRLRAALLFHARWG
ncbi:MAG: hypothetical protein H6713_18665 [Myxococcales bacterium]|nr:hypothetical protein [Myxococcales bacterium]